MNFCSGFWFGFGVFLPVCFDGGFVCLLVGFFVCIFVWFGFLILFFLLKISFIASSTSHLWNMPYQLSIQMGVMLLLQLTAGFQTVHVSHNDNKLTD